MVAGDVPGRIEPRRHMGVDPVVVAVLGAVDHVGEDLAAGLDGIPQQLEYAARHGRMAHDVVRRVQQLGLGIAADVDEDVVAVGDDAFTVGLADDELRFGKGSLLPRQQRYGGSHWRPSQGHVLVCL